MRGLLSLLLIGGAVALAEPPNFVVIVADDLGYADVGFQGCQDIPTPHLDRLARSGVRCTNGYVTAPVCSPTRAGLLTGRYQQRFGYEYNIRYLPEEASLGLPLDQVTLPQLLKQNGYNTALVGKWHLGAHPKLHPNQRGFTDFFGFLGGGHHYTDHNQFQTNPMRAKQEYLTPILRNDQPEEVHEYLTNVLGQEAAKFVEANKSSPFFLYLAFNAPHTPLQAPDQFLDRVKTIDDPKRRTYAAMVAAMDDAIGVVLAKLRELELERDTLVIFFSDNGGPTNVTNASNGPLRGAKGSLYEGGIRVPFVVSWPGVLKPGTFDGLVSSLDVFPTVLLASETAPPRGLKLDGQELLSRFKQRDKPAEHRSLFWRFGPDQHAIRHGNLKMLKLGSKAPELYDLSQDVGEETNLAARHPERVGEFQKLLDEWEAGLIAPKWPALAAPMKKPEPNKPSTR